MTHEMSDDLAKRVEAALCDNYPMRVANPDYDRNVGESEKNLRTMPNKQTKWDFACEKAGNILLSQVSRFEGQQVQQKALEAKTAEIQTLSIKTS